MSRTSISVAIILLLGSTLLGAGVPPSDALKPDSLPSFDAASVKVNYLPAFLQPPKIRITPGRFTARSQTLKTLTQFAFEMVSDSLLIGGPAWFDSTRFDIDAVASGASVPQIRSSLQRLLLERFLMVARPEVRPMPVFRLVRGRSDGKLGMRAGSCDPVKSEASKQPCGGIATGPASLQAFSVTMTRFATSLSQLVQTTGVHRPVIDETGLSDAYDFKLEFEPVGEHYGLFWNRKEGLPDFSTALRDQLGLRLDSATLPTRVIVVEKASLPTPN